MADISRLFVWLLSLALLGSSLQLSAQEDSRLLAEALQCFQGNMEAQLTLRHSMVPFAIKSVVRQIRQSNGRQQVQFHARTPIGVPIDAALHNNVIYLAIGDYGMKKATRHSSMQDLAQLFTILPDFTERSLRRLEFRPVEQPEDPTLYKILIHHKQELHYITLRRNTTPPTLVHYSAANLAGEEAFSVEFNSIQQLPPTTTESQVALPGGIVYQTVATSDGFIKSLRAAVKRAMVDAINPFFRSKRVVVAPHESNGSSLPKGAETDASTAVPSASSTIIPPPQPFFNPLRAGVCFIALVTVLLGIIICAKILRRRLPTATP